MQDGDGDRSGRGNGQFYAIDGAEELNACRVSDTLACATVGAFGAQNSRTLPHMNDGRRLRDYPFPGSLWIVLVWAMALIPIRALIGTCSRAVDI